MKHQTNSEKKYVASTKDKKDWTDFTKHIGNISPKEDDILKVNIEINKIRKLDLHGFSLSQSNKIVKKFIIESFNRGYKKLLIVTGKGLRSKVYNDIYRSKKMSVLKHSVPEYIKHDEDLLHRINKIENAYLKDGGEGAIYIYLKNL